jgi:uncharacterized membrane protein YcaP (DUF421 family)
MFAQEIPFAEKIIRTVVVYLVILILLRLTGKRGLAGLNSLDIVVMVLLSNVVQNAIIGPDNSVTGGVIGAVVLVAMNSALNRAALSNEKVARLFDGTPTTVIDHGRLLPGPARQVGLRRGDLDQAVRLQNGDDIDQVQTGVLEPNGHLLLTLKPDEQGATRGDIAALRDHLARLEDLVRSRLS